MAAATVRVEVVGSLDRAEVEAVTWLVEAATDLDGVRPLSEHVTLHLAHGGDPAARNVLVWVDAPDAPVLAGYAHLDTTDVVEGPSAEVVVRPDLRRRGFGRLLVQTLAGETGDDRMRLWAHGTLPAAAALAGSLGFAEVRRLRRLRRPLAPPVAAAEPPPGVELRTFRVGVDEDPWLALNGRAFAHHPEQGSWTRADLDERMAEPWFDPSGFLLAERDGRLVAFDWTKVHGQRSGQQEQAHGHEAIGEIYVIGVDPSEQGHGLGLVLAVAGLRHLRALGLGAAMLYVEADNAAALRLYERLGFTAWDTDVVYSRADRRSPSRATMADVPTPPPAS